MEHLSLCSAWTDLTLEMYQNFPLMNMPGVLQSAVWAGRYP